MIVMGMRASHASLEAREPSPRIWKRTCGRIPYRPASTAWCRWRKTARSPPLRSGTSSPASTPIGSMTGRSCGLRVPRFRRAAAHRLAASLGRGRSHLVVRMLWLESQPERNPAAHPPGATLPLALVPPGRIAWCRTECDRTVTECPCLVTAS